MDELLKELERTGNLTSTVSFFDVFSALFLSFALSLVLGWVYRATHRGVSYSQQYVHTLVMMGTTVSLIMLIIGSNVARAFALVGALSIIRFRNAMKETRDVGFIFLVMATIHWKQVAVASAGAVIGSFVGVWILRRLDEKVLRVVIVAIGVALAIGLFIRGS